MSKRERENAFEMMIGIEKMHTRRHTRTAMNKRERKNASEMMVGIEREREDGRYRKRTAMSKRERKQAAATFVISNRRYKLTVF